MKKFLVIVLGIILAITSLIGCSSDGGDQTDKGDTQSQTTDESDVSLVFAIDLGNNEVANQLTKDIISEYEAKTGVKVQLEAMPMGDYRTWLTTQFSAGEGPDIYTGILYDIVSDYSNGWLYNFKDLYQAESAYDPGQAWKDTLPDTILERMYIDNNTVPGYPSSTSVVRIFCNKDLFEKAGVEIPTTWEEFLAACEKLKESGVTPFGFPNATIADLSWLWFNNSISSQLNSELVAELDESGNGFVELAEIVKGMDEGKIDFTQPELQEGFELMKEFSQYWTSDYNGLDQASAIDMFMRGDVAMVQALSTDLSKIIVGIEDRFAYEAMPVPVITKDTAASAMEKSVILGGQPDIIYAINKNAEQDEAKLEAAVDFAQYMSSPEIQVRYAEEVCRIPLATSTELPDSLSGFIITEEPLRMAYYTGINEKLRNYFHRAGQQYLEGSLTTAEFGEMVNGSYQEVLDEVKAENGWSAENNYGIGQ
ncbi:MAG: ABC transporter substrate-binding protein [Lachnospiraceae bacterium]